MRLDLATWGEVEAYLARHARPGIILPVGSTEQHGPMGLIGTDALCATAIAEGAGHRSGAYVAPTLAYTPAPFNALFPGTISVSEDTFAALFQEVTDALVGQGFRRLYVLNAHGANLAPMRAVARTLDTGLLRLCSWWELPTVHAIRQELYGAWEGLHATPSEIAMTQALHRRVAPGAAANPPRALSTAEKRRRAGDAHGTAEQHKAEFPDGRVGSHSALATPEHGRDLLAAAIDDLVCDFEAFIAAC